jgi:HPt (histidine-containing phosphotransfer) domain-containing protein
MSTNLQQPTLSSNSGNVTVTHAQDGTPIWQLSNALKQFLDDGDHEWIRELIDCFLSDSQERLILLREAATNGSSFETISGQAHALEGSARDVGAGVLAEICAEIERRARVREGANYKTLVSQVESSFDDLQRILMAFRGSLPR